MGLNHTRRLNKKATIFFPRNVLQTLLPTLNRPPHYFILYCRHCYVGVSRGMQFRKTSVFILAMTASKFDNDAR